MIGPTKKYHLQYIQCNIKRLWELQCLPLMFFFRIWPLFLYSWINFLLHDLIKVKCSGDINFPWLKKKSDEWENFSVKYNLFEWRWINIATFYKILLRTYLKIIFPIKYWNHLGNKTIFFVFVFEYVFLCCALQVCKCM